MAGRIPQQFIDDLLDRVDIVEIIDKRVPLKKSGKNYSACCPFHDEKTPSFSVSPDKQFYYCFGCGAAGNAIGFLIEYEHQDFPQVVESLAQSQGLEVPREDDGFTNQRGRQDLYSIMEQACKFYQEQFRSHPEAAQAVSYLQDRGLIGQVAHRFGMGFAPPGWDNLLAFAGRTPTDAQLLQQTGMTVLKEETKRSYDRFRHRIMFPIRDLRGRVIAFGGRVLGDDKPKYLNSPETEIFHKNRELYGLYEANKVHRRLERLLIVEGYMDVVMLAQHGIDFAAATLGTAAGTSHLEKAFRYTTEVVFCFDGDAAGRRAAERALVAALPALKQGRQVKFMFLPDGEDPDSLVQAVGAGDFLNRIQQALPLSEYLFDSHSSDLNLNTAEGRASLANRIAPQLAKVPEGVFKQQLKNLLITQSQTDAATIRDLMSASKPAEEITLQPPPAVITTTPPSSPPQHTATHSKN